MAINRLKGDILSENVLMSGTIIMDKNGRYGVSKINTRKGLQQFFYALKPLSKSGLCAIDL